MNGVVVILIYENWFISGTAKKKRSSHDSNNRVSGEIVKWPSDEGG